ncbi:hypothetical protein [Salinibaculum rarum]|uniref:hypothetical protein n=1 Tax=Salinibaculum rarum TaxID=3058903 RepID=UPI00265F6E5A|nr:hypothetical protein [Salinibaculum sp. KK48]
MRRLGETSSFSSRGVSAVIGFILIFGIVTIAYTTYLGTAVPQQNWQAEYSHNQQAQQQMLELRDAILRTGTTGTAQTTTIQLGVDYPERLLTPNLAVSGGEIGTLKPNPDGSNNITLTNITAIDSETADYLDSTTTELNYTTRDIAYVPTYTRYRNAPTTTITAGTVFNTFDTANLSVGGQFLIKGDRISLVVLNGSLRESGTGGGATATVTTTPLSVSTESVRVQNTGDKNITLTIPTTIADRSAWHKSGLEDQDKVTDVSVTGSNVTIELAQGTYNLRMMKVGVGTGTVDPDATYIVDREGLPTELSEDRTGQVTVEVRDRYNNPISGASVTGEIVTADTGFNGNGDLFIGNSGAGDTASGSTTSDGELTFTYRAPNDDDNDPAQENVELTFYIKGNSTKYERVTETVTIVDDDGNSGNPGDQACDGTSIRINKIQQFTADSQDNLFEIQQIQAKDDDGDNDLDRIELVVTDQSGTTVATKTIDPANNQQQIKEKKIDIDAGSYDVVSGETYTLTATVYDADGNCLKGTRDATA